MQIYVAAKFENKQEVRRVQKILEANGHTITYDWTQEDATGREGDALQYYLQQCAVNDHNAVFECDVMLFLSQNNCQGAFTELGLAIAWGRPVYIVGHTTNIFTRLGPEYGVFTFDTVEQALEAIDRDEFQE
jgi:nucleoside 2-deoxyribosyltransferase